MKRYILGTDWWTDCDDAVALRMLARAHKRGDISLLGIGVNACMEHSVTSLEGYLNLEQLRGIPIGIDIKATDFGGEPPYQARLSKFAEQYKRNHDAGDAVRLYREILENEQGQLEIIEIGYPQVLADVLQSQSDDISNKTGMELVQEKVKKIWMMAGKWDEEGGKENNFCRNMRAREAAERVCRICPVPITFLGWEVAADVITGKNLDKDDFLYHVLCDHGSYNGRSSWDPMLVQLALIGNEDEAGYKVVRGTARVDALTGENYFEKSELGNHVYVVRKYSPVFYEEQIEKQIQSYR